MIQPVNSLLLLAPRTVGDVAVGPMLAPGYLYLYHYNLVVESTETM